MNFKKAISFIMAVSMLSVPLYSCSSKTAESSTSESSVSDESSSADETKSGDSESGSQLEMPNGTTPEIKDLGDGIVARIGDTDISEDEFRYYFMYAKSYIDDGDDSYWDDDENNEKINNLKEQTLRYLFDNSTIYRMASNNGVEITDEDMAEIENQKQTDILYYNTALGTSLETFDDFLKETYCTEEVYRLSYERQQLEYKLVATLYQDDFIKNYYEGYICAKYIQIKDHLSSEESESEEETKDETASASDYIKIADGLEYSDEETEIINRLNSYASEGDEESLRAALPELISIISTQISEGADFDTLMTKYNQDENATPDISGKYTGYYLYTGAMNEEFMSAASALEENQRTEEAIYNSTDGYFFIEREPLDSNYLITLYMGDDEYTYATDYQTLYSNTQESLPVILDDDFENITVESMANK